MGTGQKSIRQKKKTAAGRPDLQKKKALPVRGRSVTVSDWGTAPSIRADNSGERRRDEDKKERSRARKVYCCLGEIS